MLKEEDIDMPFIDEQGMIRNPGQIVTIQDFRSYWNKNRYTDPVLSQYDTFNDWWQDSKQWFPIADNYSDGDGEDCCSSTKVRKFTVTASANRRINAAADDKVNPAQERADELQERIEDDFDYVVAGIERLEREGQFDAAIDIMEKIADTLDAAIGVIGEDFVSEEDFDEEI